MPTLHIQTSRFDTSYIYTPLRRYVLQTHRKKTKTMGKFWGSCSWGILAVSLLVLGVWVPEGCCQDTSCLNQLVPCLNYLNGTEDVPSSCCDPLQNVIKSDQQCICSMISNQGSNQAEQAGINVTEAQQLPARCGIHVNPLNCLSSGIYLPFFLLSIPFSSKKCLSGLVYDGFHSELKNSLFFVI